MKGKFLVIAGVIVLLLAAIAIKLIFFPSIKDAYFAISVRGLQDVPRGLMVLRPTHYPFLKHADPVFMRSPHSRTNFSVMCRNAPLRDLIKVAYGEEASSVVLPPDAPKGNFDLLITDEKLSNEQLQAILQRKLGCRAHKEMREVDVLALKVVDPGLPGLKASNPDSPRYARNDNVKINFMNLPVSVVCQVLKQFYGINVVDKTGLTDSYNYSLPLPVTESRQLSDDAIHDSANDYIKNLGLGLEPDTALEEVLVVKMGPPSAPVMIDKKQILLGPLNPGAEEGSEHWHHSIEGNSVLLTDSTDAASGDNDFTVENTNTNQHDHAEWRCATFPLGPATNGARPITFSFDYKLPRPVNDGDNVRVQLRFFNQNTNFIDQKVFWLGANSHDSAMTSYKTVTTDNIQPPTGARLCDVTLSANLYDDKWSSGIARFDNILVTTGPRPSVPP